MRQTTKEFLSITKPPFDAQKERLALIGVIFGDVPQVIVNDHFITSCSFIPSLELAEYLKMISCIVNSLILTVLSGHQVVSGFKVHRAKTPRMRIATLSWLKISIAALSIYSASHWSFYETPAFKVGQSLKSGKPDRFELQDRFLVTLKDAVIAAKEGKNLTFDFCCDDPMFRPEVSMTYIYGSYQLPDVSQHLDNCKMARLQIKAIFVPSSTLEADTVHFHSIVTYLFVNATHLHWDSPAVESALPFELRITGIDGASCRPDVRRKKSDKLSDSATFAFPFDKNARIELKEDVKYAINTIQTVCRTKIDVRLLIGENGTGFVTFPTIANFSVSHKVTIIGNGAIGRGTFFPDGYTICVRFVKIGRRTIFLNSYGHLTMLNQFESAMSIGTSLNGSIYSGNVFGANISNKFACLIPHQKSRQSILDPSTLYERWNHFFVDGARIGKIRGRG